MTLYNKYKSEGLEILGFPSGQFGGQEFDSASEIQSFVKGYGVEFPIMEKGDVNGANASPVYKFLLKDGGNIIWNFATKFIIDKEGKVLKRVDGMKAPLDLESDIVELLNA